MIVFKKPLQDFKLFNDPVTIFLLKGRKLGIYEYILKISVALAALRWFSVLKIT